ncbi:PREDICTED: trinucleotide repeat-containing gene 18 protein-like, partial [Thamnophis sirtalis]|uniref:Trinucleotide repeat-containing gene 18 protein-like n=2 Tax=Thamnophis TaxID=34999 RepID=A0A6I9Z007_9SAUR
MAVKMKKLEVGLKMKSRHLKVSNSPAVSEVSSYSYNTDSEEEEESLKDEWSSHSATGARMRPSGLYSVMAPKCSRISDIFKARKKTVPSTRTLKSKLAANRKQEFCLFSREIKAGSSYSDSSEESFDQDSSSEEEEEDE